MSRFLYRVGFGAAAHPWRTICAWVLVAGATIALATSFGGTPHDDYDIPDARAQQGMEMLRAHTPGAGDATARVVVHDPDGTPLTDVTLAGLRASLSEMDHAVVVSEPRLSEDDDTAIFSVQYDVPVTDEDLMGNSEPLEDAVADTRESGLQVELGGDVPESAAAPMKGTGELVGVIAALLILVLAFGSVTSAGLPVSVALVGLGVGSGGITLLAAIMDVSTAAPMVATMVGLGVGIDYALLLVTRHVEYLRAGYDVREAAGRASATAGRSVVFASATVLVSLMGLRLSGLPVYASFGFSTGIAVVAVAAAALTLVPALCRLGGRRMMPCKVRRGRETEKTPLTARWATRVGRNPLPWALVATLVMVTLALPTLSMRTWPQDASSSSTELSPRKAYDIVADEFGPGANGPLVFAVDLAEVEDPEAVAHTVRRFPGIEGVTPVQTSRDGALGIFEAQPSFGPSDERTGGLVDDLRAELPNGVELTGNTAFFADIVDLLAERVWLVIGFVVALSILLLGLVFRSVIVPLKAAVMNLLSIGAAYGVVTAVFQWGWGVELLGLDHSMPVSSWIPILMFAILFGLSMDYEVFLLSRIREDWLTTGDAHGSVVRGLASTGRVISSAAAIMVAVFLGFASETDVTVKMLGIGMAVAIALDATLVRMVLVPATMSMLGRRNWWVPGWLDRLMPEVSAELDEIDNDNDDDKDDDLQPVGV